MKIIEANTTKQSKEVYFHTISFNFAGENFVATIRETDQDTTIIECLHEDWTKIDIPEYFGKGFSARVQAMLYDSIVPIFI